ncbi:MAG: 2-C-methyl-D-erythritol 2,4-cyclodiphosphate synthase, partial [Deltaproteobacteria bacterium]|nr:2-C-methyl-D-erythritol 2,4-cyclodiphosphate synthase [Deltaproteobacteria bacterium]
FTMSCFAVILAAGQGSRFSQNSQADLKKQYVKIEGLPLWAQATCPFEQSPRVDKILIVVPPEDVLGIQSELSNYSLSKVMSVIGGGVRRQDSVWAALQWIDTHQESPARRCEMIFIHDGARPFVTQDLIERLWKEKETGAVIPVISVTDTLKFKNGEWVEKTLDRSRCVRVQTPQLFSYALLLQAFEYLKSHPQEVTDDAAVLELIGEKVKIVLGEEENIKITTPQDLKRSQESLMRVGQGMDVHPFCEGQKLILGGIKIPFSKGLQGHSDADVLTHAICDSLLGAAGLSDIGTYFPDHDPQYKNSSSLTLLEKVVDKIGAAGYTINNVDVTVVAEAPKLQPTIPEMKICLAKVMKISINQIAIKATTTEKMGFVGRGEGIVAFAIATLKI